jgi:hypothetical protein
MVFSTDQFFEKINRIVGIKFTRKDHHKQAIFAYKCKKNHNLIILGHFLVNGIGYAGKVFNFQE